ncbi:hypothetical protein A3Q56_01850 [Intoshia linei]|uniref:Amidase domain-containing protein n=1 Tax=Intoshia linei TaxID=1819745 RepID=A0A177BA39_9BILA|nr:hypothetical protein A3Q56_01850 [Intoshia linei]
MCGIVGIKPTQNRVSTSDMYELEYGANLILPVNGPLARDVDGLVLIVKSLLSDTMYKLDPTLISSYFCKCIFNNKKKLKIGYFLGSKNLSVLPCMRQAVHLTTDTLKSKVHTIVEWEPIGLEDSLKLKVIELFKDDNIDVFIVPGYSVPSVSANNTVDKEISIWPVVYANVINFVAGTLPITHVCEQDLKDMEIEKETNKTWCFNQLTQMWTNSIGMPINIQVYGQPNSEELVLFVMKHFEFEIYFERKKFIK